MKEKRLVLRWNGEEAAYVKECARQANMTLSDWVRRLIGLDGGMDAGFSQFKRGEKASVDWVDTDNEEADNFVEPVRTEPFYD